MGTCMWQCISLKSHCLDYQVCIFANYHTVVTALVSLFASQVFQMCKTDCMGPLLCIMIHYLGLNERECHFFFFHLFARMCKNCYWYRTGLIDSMIHLRCIAISHDSLKGSSKSFSDKFPKPRSPYIASPPRRHSSCNVSCTISYVYSPIDIKTWPGRARFYICIRRMCNAHRCTRNPIYHAELYPSVTSVIVLTKTLMKPDKPVIGLPAETIYVPKVPL